MTQKTTYRCNLCQNQFDPVTPNDTGVPEGLSLYFTADGFEQKRAYECQVHVCEKCTRALTAMLR